MEKHFALSYCHTLQAHNEKHWARSSRQSS